MVGFYFFCDRGKHRNAKRYNSECNFLSGGETKVTPKIVQLSLNKFTMKCHYTNKVETPICHLSYAHYVWYVLHALRVFRVLRASSSVERRFGAPNRRSEMVQTVAFLRDRLLTPHPHPRGHSLNSLTSLNGCPWSSSALGVGGRRPALGDGPDRGFWRKTKVVLVKVVSWIIHYLHE